MLDLVDKEKSYSPKTGLAPKRAAPKRESKSSRCDTYGKDCAVITKLLHKIEELRNCTNETIDTSAFDLPNWVDVPPPAIPYLSPTETLLCYGDLYCNKEMLQEDYDRERERCGLEPENLISRRRKRQFLPYNRTHGKWDSFPIMISFLEDELPDNYRAWKAAINVGADMIMQHTCVQFKIVNVEKKANYSEGILIRDSSDNGKCVFGQSKVGKVKVGCWQELELAMEHTCSHLQPNMSVVACHELLHALGNLHEQSRSDARSFVILRRQTKQSMIRNGTENFGFDYDFGSVLHYGGRYDAENDQYSLITLPRFYQQTIGQRERISFKDAALINQIYCKGKSIKYNLSRFSIFSDSCKGHEDKCQNGGYLNPNDCTKCHCPDGYGGKYCKELEENENCNMLPDEPRELKSDQTVKVLNPMIGCTSAGNECRAKLCCPRALTDLDGNEYKNWIAAEKPDMDIVISAHLSPNWTVPSTVFELTYESGNAKLINSSKCPHAENVYAEKRNPGTGTLRCYNPTKKQYYDCSCHGDKKCLAEEKWAHDRFLCPIMQVNGIQLQKDPRYNWTRLDIDCYKAEAGTVSFWGYSKPDTKEIIRVDEIHCLTDGVLKWFKSLQVDEQSPMKLSPTSPFLANNDASSLIHVFVPFV
ncbi:hypothetical protein niasHT_025505 [Heterodera trifolii]|uniref:Metalloendopeptidase n=1 Tax=Heterodera trifolii TaxID=157864 RepID=A0ABD2J8P4_9BILA